jgi:hypothetical protein
MCAMQVEGRRMPATIIAMSKIVAEGCSTTLCGGRLPPRSPIVFSSVKYGAGYNASAVMMLNRMPAPATASNAPAVDRAMPLVVGAGVWLSVRTSVSTMAPPSSRLST